MDLSFRAVVVQLHPLQGAGEGRGPPSPPGAPGQSSSVYGPEQVNEMVQEDAEAEVDYHVYVSLHSSLPWSKMESLQYSP